MRDVTILSQRDVEELIRFHQKKLRFKMVEYRFKLIEDKIDKLRMKLNDIDNILAGKKIKIIK